VLLGIRKRADFSEATVKMEIGDVVVFYTDGVTEARNSAGEMFGTSRLAAAVAERRAHDAEHVVDGVLAALDRFAEGTPRDDDLTVVVMKYVG
jgi:sigma-B regulation protein RsbU (phosphoserine phosphatase)